MKSTILRIIPWLITLLALYLAFKDIDFQELYTHLSKGNLLWIALACLLTLTSYVLRACRWEYFFQDNLLSLSKAYKVLILGFFMNNILPARAGEVVRAHLGARLTNTTRTLVLATVASERLADGVTLSLFFVLTAHFFAHSQINGDIMLVAYLFFLAALLILCVLFFRQYIFKLNARISSKINKPAFAYLLDRVEIFLNGLTPLFNLKKLPFITFYSVIVWSIELAVYYAVSLAFSADLSFLACVVFMVAVNFSSLIPAAPGGIGVIEAVATAVLVGIGIDKELALSMVITQHAIQFIMIAIPGLIFMISLRTDLRKIKDTKDTNALHPSSI